MCFEDNSKEWGLPTDSAPTVEELELMHRSLSADQREELLECLLIAE